MLCAIATMLAVLGARQSDTLVDTPKTHWIFEAKTSMQNEGLMVGYPVKEGDKQPRPMTRYEFAVAFHGAYTNLKTDLEELKKQADKVTHDPAGSKEADEDTGDLTSELKAMRAAPFRKAVDYLPRTQKEFSKELATLGVPPNPFTATVNDYHRTMAHFKMPQAGSALVQFPDVPADHWAAKAVLELRQAGILDGYPDGKFGG